MIKSLDKSTKRWYNIVMTKNYYDAQELLWH
jgi:hypothetical protein